MFKTQMRANKKFGLELARNKIELQKIYRNILIQLTPYQMTTPKIKSEGQMSSDFERFKRILERRENRSIWTGEIEDYWLSIIKEREEKLQTEFNGVLKELLETVKEINGDDPKMYSKIERYSVYLRD